MWRIIAGLCAAVSTAACTSSSAPDTSWYEGAIVARDVAISIGDPPSVHVRAAGEECGIIFLLRSSTRIRPQGAGVLASGSYADLTVGTRVRVSARLVLDSCPGQSTAGVIEIVGED
jgi:molybdopterin biosynthesis enzyme